MELAQKDVERWREVVLLAGAEAARGAHHSAWSLVAALCPDACDAAAIKHATDRDWWLAMLAVQVWNETGIARVTDLSRANQNCVAHVRAWLAALLDGGHLPPVDRAAAGAVLGHLGNRRKGVGLCDVGLPDIDWIEIPAGPFTMGNKKGQTPEDDETPQFTCKLLTQPYRIARYPVTVAQYQAFVDAGGYGKRRCWTDAGWEWKESEKITGPEDYDPALQTPNHPRVGVSWFEALAFCHWLTVQFHSSFVIPQPAQRSPVGARRPPNRWPPLPLQLERRRAPALQHERNRHRPPQRRLHVPQRPGQVLRARPGRQRLGMVPHEMA